MNRSADFDDYSPRELAEWIISRSGIEGVTLSGGDPFDQPLTALADFLVTLRAKRDLSVMCYTGRTMAALKRKLDQDLAQKILGNIDILIDGLYVEELNDGSLWRGSSNQQIHFLTDRYRSFQRDVNNRRRRLEVIVSNDGEFRITGIPDALFMERLTRELLTEGIELLAGSDLGYRDDI